MNLLLKAVVALALLWAAVATIMWAANRATPTPETIAAYLTEHPLQDQSSEDRERIIRKAAAQINQLDFEDRRRARENREDREESDPAAEFFRSMTPAEQALFTKLTIGPTFDHLMQALNEMEPEERKQIAADAVERLREDGNWTERESAEWGERGGEIFEKVTSEGLRAYYEEANADTKLDLAPVLEEMQHRLQNPRRKWKRPD